MPRDPELDAQMDECRVLLGEIRGATKDLHHEIRESRRAISELVDLEIKPIVVEKLTEMTGTIREHTDTATQAVFNRFDALTNMLLTGKKDGRSDFNLETWARDNIGDNCGGS